MDQEKGAKGWILNFPPSCHQWLTFYESEHRFYNMVFWKFSLKFLICSLLKSRHPECQIVKSFECYTGCSWPGHGEPLRVFLIKSVDHINVVDKSFISIMGHGLEIGRGPPWREKNVWCKTSRGRAAGRFKRRSQQLGWRQNWDRRGRSSGWCYVLIDLASSIVPTDEMGHTRKADLSKAEFGELIEYPVRNVN